MKSRNGSTAKRHIELKEFLISKGLPMNEVNGIIERYAMHRNTKADRAIIDEYITSLQETKRFNASLQA